MLKENKMNYRGMYSYVNNVRRLCLIDFDNGERLIGYYDYGRFVKVNGLKCDHVKECNENPSVGHYVIHGDNDEEVIKYFMDLCEIIFDRDDYSGIVGGN